MSGYNFILKYTLFLTKRQLMSIGNQYISCRQVECAHIKLEIQCQDALFCLEIQSHIMTTILMFDF